METIKTSPNVEFDVIYDDGTRKRVREGVLLEAEATGDIILHNATDRPAVWCAATETMLMALYACNALPVLATGMTITTEAFAALKCLTELANQILYTNKPATFRLGQMDFQQCAADMLEDAAKESVDPLLESALHCASEMVRKMEIHGGANEGKA